MFFSEDGVKKYSKINITILEGKVMCFSTTDLNKRYFIMPFEPTSTSIASSRYMKNQYCRLARG